MSESDELHRELKVLIVETLMLEDITPEAIETEAPLFGDGLGLDSIDSLEIAMVLEDNYGVILDEDPDANREIFQSVGSLARFVEGNRQT